MLSAAIEIAARDGYEATTISQIIADAGVSRPTFYDYFADKDACLLSAIAAVNEHLLAQVEQRANAQPPARAAYASIEAIFELCVEHPTMARVLLDASLAGPPQALDARSEGITAIARVIDAAHSATPSNELLPDIGAYALIAGVQRLLGASLRREHTPDGAMLAAVRSWIESYGAPASQRQWAALRISSPTRPTPVVPKLPFGRAPVASQRDHPGGPVEHARLRLLFAAGELCEAKGIGATTLAEIASRARVSYRTLKRLYSSKEELFVALNETGCRRTLAATFGAFFSASSWPERVWSAAQASTELVASTPAMDHIAFVDSYAAGPLAARNMDTMLKTFTLFLADGDAHLAKGLERPSQLAREAIVATIFDLGYCHCRAGRSPELPGVLPQAIFIALTPFLGPQETARFISSKLDALQGAAA
jgi:AcrR family transcriptional regulator